MILYGILRQTSIGTCHKTGRALTIAFLEAIGLLTTTYLCHATSHRFAPAVIPCDVRRNTKAIIAPFDDPFELTLKWNGLDLSNEFSSLRYSFRPSRGSQDLYKPGWACTSPSDCILHRKSLISTPLTAYCFCSASHNLQ